MVKFGTLEYFQKVAEAVNANDEMKKTNINLTMMYYIPNVKLPNGKESRHLLKFENGQIVEIREASPSEDADIIYEAKSDIFQRVFSGTLKAEDAMRTGWLKVNYKLGKLLRYKKALDVYGKILPTVQAEF